MPPNYVSQRTPGTSYVSTYLRGPAPLNTALGRSCSVSIRFRSQRPYLRASSTHWVKSGLHSSRRQQSLRAFRSATGARACRSARAAWLRTLLSPARGASAARTRGPSQLAVISPCLSRAAALSVSLRGLGRARRSWCCGLTMCCSGRRGRHSFQPNTAARRR